MDRRAVVTGAAVAVAATATGGGWWYLGRPKATPASAEVPTGTATVTRVDLTATTQVEGALGYVGSFTLFAQGAGGTVTALPQPGQVITRGQPVFALDNRPVRLFYADRPAWRALAAGATNGPDVRAVEENLVALGYANAANLTVDEHFNASTAAALRRWQYGTGQLVTGRLDLGAVLFMPGPIRVTTVTAKLGSTNHGDEAMLSATSNATTVTVAVPTTRTAWVHVGDKVTVTLPAGDTVPGTVTSLSKVADSPEQSNDGRPPGRPTVPATVTLDTPDATAGLDRAPVQVNITSTAARNVLAVPVVALVALAGGGFGVYVREGANRRLVGVTLGVFADALVEVKGGDLREGATVEVPAG